MSKYLISAIAVLAIAVGGLSWQLNKSKAENKRLSSNQETLLSDIKFYKTESGNNAASVQRLELTKSELEKYCDELVTTVKGLNIKISRMQAASTTATQSEYKIVTVAKDSIVYRDTTITLQTIRYNDPWIDFDGVIDSGTFSGNISTRDTLVQVIHRVPKRFLFFKFGTKAIRQEVVSSNPYTRITYIRYIELK